MSRSPYLIDILFPGEPAMCTAAHDATNPDNCPSKRNACTCSPRWLTKGKGCRADCPSREPPPEAQEYEQRPLAGAHCPDPRCPGRPL